MTDRQTSSHQISHRRIRTHLCVVLGFAVIALGLFACTSAQVRDGTRFWGDHARAAVFGDDPSRD